MDRVVVSCEDPMTAMLTPETVNTAGAKAAAAFGPKPTTGIGDAATAARLSASPSGP